jgi:hypothetical protein
MLLGRSEELAVGIAPSNVSIESIPEISAVYFALLQGGYDFYEVEKPVGLADKIGSFIFEDRFPFFDDTKQTTCSVYPYWPRAAILETATFFLDSTKSAYTNFSAFKQKIMSLTNISDVERDSALWEWIKDYPVSLNQVMNDHNFQSYFEWEKGWVKQKSINLAESRLVIQNYLDVCSKLHSSPIKRVLIVLNPIKCAYSADYHMNGDGFIFCSGAFSIESIIHEYLHHVVHSTVISHSENILRSGSGYPGIDRSYYLDDDNTGKINAFEEFFVRTLTGLIVSENPPKNLDRFMEELF